MRESGQGHSVVLGSVTADVAQGRRARCKAISLHILHICCLKHQRWFQFVPEGGRVANMRQLQNRVFKCENTPWMATCAEEKGKQG